MRPEWALLGTCTTIPREELARWAVGELLAIRAFQLWGNATTIPVRSPLPLINSSPPTDTWRGLVEQWIAGTHTALESVKGFMGFALVFFFVFADGFGELPPVALLVGAGDFGEAPPFAGMPPLDGALVPPAPCEALAAGASWVDAAQTAQSVTTAALCRKEVERLSTALATNHPFWRTPRLGHPPPSHKTQTAA